MTVLIFYSPVLSSATVSRYEDVKLVLLHVESAAVKGFFGLSFVDVQHV